jgi:hypothetical protein
MKRNKRKEKKREEKTVLKLTCMSDNHLASSRTAASWHLSQNFFKTKARSFCLKKNAA